MKHILVVDDNADILETFKLILEEKGYTVTTLQKGDKVIEVVQDISPDLVLLDIFLSGTNGVDICKNLKTIHETKHIPVVMVSAHSNSARVYNYCGADAFIEKPFNISDLTAVIKQLLLKVVR